MRDSGKGSESVGIMNLNGITAVVVHPNYAILPFDDTLWLGN